MSNSTLGTESNPIITDTVPISAGTAIVIGTAGSAIVLSQTAIRAWRRVSLSQIHGLHYARMHVLILTLCVSSAVGAIGAFHFFPDDARALGGLLPVLGVLAPFVFLARRPDDTTGATAYPTRTRLVDWLVESPLNIVLMVPGVVLAGLCVWGMVEANSWDVLALSFSIAVAVFTRSDPLLYFAWDGVAPRWQWGRLLPCPSRMPSWRFVVGRVEDEDENVDIMVDAMEVPATDSRMMQGQLSGEDERVSDRTLAVELREKGAHRALPHFYEYADRVWGEVIHGIGKGSVVEGKQLDEAAASCFLLIVAMLREGLREQVAIGADVWLLLGILQHRLNSIAFDYINASNWRKGTRVSRMKVLGSSIWSAMSGRARGTPLLLDDDLVDELERAELGNQDVDVGEDEDAGEGASNEDGNGERSGERGDEMDDADNGEDVRVVDQVESDTKQNDNEVDSETNSGHYSLQMFQAFGRAEEAPATSDSSKWIEWVLQVLEDLYRASIGVLKQGTSVAGLRQATGMEPTFREWIGDGCYTSLIQDIGSALEADANVSMEDKEVNEGRERVMTQVEEGVTKVAKEEAWGFMMLALAKRYTVSVGRDSEVGFESAGINVSNGELNGRLKAQNMARKIVLAQVGLWGYVALGQTATALLTRG